MLPRTSSSAVSFVDQPPRVTRCKLVHAVWRGSGMEVLSGVAPGVAGAARTDDTVVGLTDVRGYPNGFVFVLRVPGLSFTGLVALAAPR